MPVIPPEVTVTLVFTDIEGSTRLWEEREDEFRLVLEQHDRVMRSALKRLGGYEVKTEGDAFMVAFGEPEAAVGFCLMVQQMLHDDAVLRELRVRMGAHQGEPICKVDPTTGRMDYFGRMVNRAARVSHSGHGGQVLVSQVVHDAVVDRLEGVVWTDLGEHALKGLEGLEHIWQVLPSPLADRSFPRINTPDLRRTNLPARITSFLGREKELGELAERLARGERLVTLLGTAGVGKTRLAQRFGAEGLAEYPGGVWFADLSEAATVEEGLSALARTLDVQLTQSDPAAQLEHAIAGRKRVLIIPDNLEHIIDAFAPLLARWVAGAPEAHFLVTSRERLRVEGESVLHIDPLPSQDAMELFADRARRASASFGLEEGNRSLVRQIVSKLDGLPLAVELAAARIAMLGPEEMLDRMGARDALAPTVSYSGILASQRRDLRDRERTLRGAIDWSWKLLQPWEQSALAQCSVFRGGFTLDAAEAVLDLSAWRQAPSGMEIVSDLVDQSLLRLSDTASGKRFSWLRSVHGYASEALEDRGESEATRARHARYFARFGAEPFIEAVRFCGDRRTNRRLFAELENLCSASAAGDPPIESASCAVAAVTAIRFCGPFTRGIELARVVLDRDDLPIHTRLPVMLSLGWLLSCVGRVDEAEAALEAGLELSRTNGEAKRSAEFLLSLGAHHYRRAQHDRARAAQEESLSIAREVGETYLQAQSLFGLANLHADRGETRTAVEYYGKALALARTLGARRLEGLVTSNQGSLLTEGNDRSLGLEYLRTALEIFEEIGDRRLQGIALTNIGPACFELGQLSEAEVCFERAQEVVSQTGHLRNLASIVGNLGDLRLHQGALEPAAEHLERAILLSDQVFPTLAGAARGALALCRARQGDFEEVRALLAKGEEQLRDVWPLEHAKLLCRRVEVEDLLGNAEASHAALAQAQAIAEKLQLGPDTFLRQSIAEAQALLAKD